MLLTEYFNKRLIFIYLQKTNRYQQYEIKKKQQQIIRKRQNLVENIK